MALLQDLIQQIDDPALRERILQETNKLLKQKKFGLVFEEHIPECTPLYDIPVRKGALVAIKGKNIQQSYMVESITGGTAKCYEKERKTTVEIPVSSLVCIARFGDPIYPCLKPIDKVENAPDSDLWHTLIEADNYHALQLLEYLYAGKVDCIYIDPPYNTGARDWKYNNDYVDSSDAYRHSKWLSMMEKRLKLAKKLLNPEDSVLIVTIDEKEYLHLGCLLEEIFPEARMQMVTSRINKKASTRVGQFARCDEYLFFLQFGSMNIQKSKYSMLDVTDNSNHNAKEAKTDTIWNSMLRRGSNGSSRRESPNLFYPVWVDEKRRKIEVVGEPLPIDVNRHDIEKKPPIPGLKAVWPIRTDNSEGRWQLGYDTLQSYLKQGIAKLGAYNKKRDQWAIVFLKKKQKEQLRDGILIATGKEADGSLILEWNEDEEQDREPKTMWVRDWHDASTYGTNLIDKVIPNRDFPFPKSLYAVEDTLRFYIADKKDALIVDFFSGSGTTLHAVNLLNAEDNGHRRCIMVTNNEVSDREAKSLYKKGLHQGDSEWEKFGIARYITWPRTVCTIEGHDSNGNPLNGNYLGSGFPMASGFKTNCEYFKLTFLDKTSIALGRQFRELFPVLWMKGGAIGRCPVLESDELPNMLILSQNKMAVLIDEIYYSEFDAEMQKHPEIRTVFIVTDSEVAYQTMIRTYDGKDCYQLYRDYLDNFRINSGR
ncbi:MAG TPA: site-specific DNA-methyltransferase [Lachnospiraceae bacterium]|uniref:Adenine-specific DNA-methyltransferase n=1 Tax=Muricomes intestini TaxID=1796634 RepID=A0A4V2US78_9FIRM|nr:DNA methyltransferase [Muricomes intestini]TCS80312.1 adenine-specific DNA-methyltransferase [Muricomes intestini]HCR81924.1 site-specific DNA-methyltransferase [Lachnospiraceae bacterium]